MEYLFLLNLLLDIATSGSLDSLEEFYNNYVIGKNFLFVNWDVKIIVSLALTGFINNDFVCHKVFVKYLLDVVLAGYGHTICSVCRDSHNVFTENFPKVAEFILPYAYLSPPDTHPSKMVCDLRRYPR